MLSRIELCIPDIELLVARHFNPRLNIIVPNVSWGLGLVYEADLVVLRPSYYAVEIEIKTSRADIARDRDKRHTHNSRLFRELWFALPAKIADDLRIPEKAGILAVETRVLSNNAVAHDLKTYRRGKLNRYALRWTKEQKQKLLELGVMRIWSLKEALWGRKKEALKAESGAR